MFEEVAVEPAGMVTSADRFMGMIDRFSVDQGRIISDFAAGRWSAEVIQAAEANGFHEIALASVVERLKEKREEKGIARLRTYPRVDGDWVANALAADQQCPFYAVVTAQGQCGHQRECGAAHARIDRPPLSVPDFEDVGRTANAIAAIAEPLIRISRTLHLIDPNVTFDGTAAVIRRWVQPLAALVARCRPGMHVVIHTSATSRIGDRRPPPELFEQRARAELQPLRAGVGVRLRRWAERPGGQQFHDRAIVSDAGGMSFGYGLDEGPTGSVVQVQRLGRAGWQALNQKFTDGTSPYDPELDIVLQGVALQ